MRIPGINHRSLQREQTAMFLRNKVQVHYLLAPAGALRESSFLLAAHFPTGTCILFLATGGVSCLDGCSQLRTLFLLVKIGMLVGNPRFPYLLTDHNSNCFNFGWEISLFLHGWLITFPTASSLGSETSSMALFHTTPYSDFIPYLQERPCLALIPCLSFSAFYSCWRWGWQYN